MAVISRLAVEMSFDGKKFKAGTKQAAADARDLEKSAKQTNSIFRTMLGTALGVQIQQTFSRAMGEVKSFVTGSIGAASDLNESISKANQVFGDGSAEMIKWSKGSASALGMSQQAALEYSGTLGNLLKGVGVANADLPKMSQTMLQAAADLGSFNNVDPGQVMQDLQSGLVGNAEPLRKYGILVNEATVKQKAMEMGLVSANGTMTEAQKVQARYALIMGQVGDAQGDFARTQGGLANGTRILQAYFKNFQAFIGSKLEPTVTKFVGRINKAVGTFQALVGKGVKPTQAILQTLNKQLIEVFGQKRGQQIFNILMRIGDGLQAVAKFIGQVIDLAVNLGKKFIPVIEFIAKHFDIIGPAIMGAVAAIVALNAVLAITEAISAVLAITLSPFLLVILALAAAGALLAVAWVKNWGDIQGKTKKVIGWLTDAFKWLKAAVTPIIDVIVLLGTYWKQVATHEIEPGNLAKIPGWLQPIAFVLGRVIKTVRVFVKTWQDAGFLAAMRKLPAQIRALGRAVAGLLDAIGFGRFAQIVKDQFRQISIIFGAVIDLVDDLVHGRWSQALGDLATIAQAYIRILLNVFRGLPAILLDVFDMIPWGRIGKLLIQGFKSLAAWQIRTGGPLFLAAGGAIMAYLWRGLSDLWSDSIKPWIQSIPGRMADFLAAGFNLFYNVGNYLIGALSNGLAAAWNWMMSWVVGLPGRITNAFQGFWNTFYNAGFYLISAFSSGIADAWEYIKRQVGNLMNSLPRPFRWALDKLTGGGGGGGGTASAAQTSAASPNVQGLTAAGNTTSNSQVSANITVNGAGDPQAVAREIVNEIGRVQAGMA